MGVTLGQFLDFSIEYLKTVDWEEQDTAHNIVTLVCGKTAQSEHFWAYVTMPPSKFLEYTIIKESGEPYNLEEFGKVMKKGWGTLPPEEVQNAMEAEHGIDHEKTLQDIVSAPFSKLIEENREA